MDRREFLVQSGLLAAGLSGYAPGARGGGVIAPEARVQSMGGDAAVRDLALRALDSARTAGAQDADVRISRNRNRSISTREQRITGLVDNETFGFGVRVLVGGMFGFAASREMTLPEAERVAREAVSPAKTNALTQIHPVVMAPVESPAPLSLLVLHPTYGAFS